MKIIFLNAWNARMLENMSDYITEQAKDTDVFCFQEAYEDMKAVCKDILSDYVELSAYKFVTEDDDFPQVTYVRKGIDIVESGTILSDEENTGLGLYMHCKVNGSNLYICNFHGMSRPVEKLDDPMRLKASHALIDFFEAKDGIKIIGGDFNIFPETESIGMFSKYNYRDLISDYSIETTRNRLAWEMYPDTKQYFSDYVFVSKDTAVTDFTVPVNEVSDHLPLVLQIKI